MGTIECSQLASKSSWDSQDLCDISMELKIAHFRKSIGPRWVNTLRQNARHFRDGIFEGTVTNANFVFGYKFHYFTPIVHRDPTDYKPKLVHVMAWCWWGNKPFPGRMLTQVHDAIYRPFQLSPGSAKQCTHNAKTITIIMNSLLINQIYPQLIKRTVLLCFSDVGFLYKFIRNTMIKKTAFIMPQQKVHISCQHFPFHTCVDWAFPTLCWWVGGAGCEKHVFAHNLRYLLI